MNHFKDRVAVVTGAGSGLGKALAEAAARRRMRLVLADVQADALDRIVQSLRAQGAEVTGMAVDVADEIGRASCRERV